MYSIETPDPIISFLLSSLNNRGCLLSIGRVGQLPETETLGERQRMMGSEFLNFRIIFP